MTPLSSARTKALAAALGLAIALVPASSGIAAKTPAKHGTVKGCSLKKKAKCKKARITKARVGKVNLSGTDLSGATITGATFTGTNLSDANLSGAKITRTTFTNVNVTRLNLDGATLANVTFVGAKGLAKQATARENNCTVVESTENGSTIECTGGGVSLHNAIITSSVGDVGVLFRNSTIPYSDFRGITTNEGHALAVGFTNTDASYSMFGAFATTRDATFSFNKATVLGAAMDGVGVWGAADTTFTGSTMLGAQDIGGTQSLADRSNTFTDVRGRNGATSVTLTQGARAVSGLTLVQVSERGAWRFGTNCTALPCTAVRVAVGVPVTATVSATSPVVLDIPGWTCTSQGPVSGFYTASCSTAAIGSAAVAGTASAPIPTRTVAVRQYFMGVTDPSTYVDVNIDELDASGNLVRRRACSGESTCAAGVLDGTPVRITASALPTDMFPGDFYLWCPGEVVDWPTLATGRPATPGDNFVPHHLPFTASCPVVTANADVTAQVSAG